MKPCLSLINLDSLSDWAIKKPDLTTRRGDKTVVLLLIFPKLMVLELELAPVIETKVQSVAVVSSGQSLDHSS